jgi:hypothetical protein
MKHCEEFNLDSSEGNFIVLGINFNVDTHLMPKLNLDKAKAVIENIFSRWEYRNLTLYGKITVIKSLALSKINHIISVIPHIIKDIKKCFRNFLWKFYDSFMTGLRLSWVKMLRTTE